MLPRTPDEAWLAEARRIVAVSFRVDAAQLRYDRALPDRCLERELRFDAELQPVVGLLAEKLFGPAEP